MITDMERRYSELSRDFKNYNIFYPLSGWLWLIAVFLAFLSYGTAIGNGGIDHNYLWIVIIALVAVSAAAAIFLKAALGVRPTKQEIPAIKAYRAHEAVVRYLDTKKSTHRRIARSKIEELRQEILGWKGIRAPLFIVKPTDELADCIKEKVLGIIKEGNPEQVRSIKDPLYSVLNLFDGGPTLDGINSVIDQFRKIPNLDNSKERDGLTFMQKYTYMKSIVIGIVVGIIVGSIAYFLEAPNYVSWIGGSGSAIAVAKYAQDLLKKQS